MARRGSRDLTVGAVFALALVVLALAVMAVGGESGFWFRQVEYRIVFPDATGLLVGAPVRMAGVQVGTVSAIHLPTDPEESGIEVRIGIAPAYTDRVRADSRAALRILQFLTNEKFVEIIAGSSDQPLLEADGTILLVVEVGVVERGEAIAESLSEVTTALKIILGRMERGEGLIGRMLQDSDFGTGGVEALSATLSNLQTLTDDMVAGKGAVGRLLYDDELAARLDDLGASIGDLSDLIAGLNDGEGLFGRLLTEDPGAEQMLDDMGEAAGSLKRITARLETDEGLLGRLIHDPELSEALAGDLESSLANLAAITEKIDAGEGTLGALVNERGLYDGAEDVVLGVHDSKFARWLTRRYRKRAVEAAERAEDAAPADEGP